MQRGTVIIQDELANLADCAVATEPASYEERVDERLSMAQTADALSGGTATLVKSNFTGGTITVSERG